MELRFKLMRQSVMGCEEGEKERALRSQPVAQCLKVSVLIGNQSSAKKRDIWSEYLLLEADLWTISVGPDVCD